LSIVDYTDAQPHEIFFCKKLISRIKAA
jgi:hypothetical protein